MNNKKFKIELTINRLQNIIDVYNFILNNFPKDKNINYDAVHYNWRKFNEEMHKIKRKYDDKLYLKRNGFLYFLKRKISRLIFKKEYYPKYKIKEK